VNSAVTFWGSQPRKIAYLGHSVTAQALGYRVLLHERLRRATGQPHASINASLGGVGSLVSACLLDYLALRHQPEVCIIETSLADAAGATPASWVGPSVEGIVRRLLGSGVLPVIVHLPRNDIGIDRIQMAREAVTAVAAHYDVPEIDLGLTAPESWLSDQVHTTPRGADAYATAILDVLLDLPLTASRLATPTLLDHHLEGATVVGIQDPVVERPEGGLRLYRGHLPYADLQIGENASLDDPQGMVLGALIIADPDSGVVSVAVGTQRRLIQVHDQWCTRPRLQGALWPDQSAPETHVSLAMTSADRGDVRADGGEPGDPHTGKNAKVVAFLARSWPESHITWWPSSEGA
jgi:hypothetical protein